MPSHTKDTSISSTSTAVDDHPRVDPHYHTKGKTCPFLQSRNQNEHAYCPAQESDVRSVCPALNTMANHGYISRDGRELSFSDIYSGLMACYGLSAALAFVLTIGGFLLIKRSPIRLPSWFPFFGKVTNPDGSKTPAGILDLHLIGLHGGVEHDASLVHHDTKPEQRYPPLEIDESWVTDLVGDVQPAVNGYDKMTATKKSGSIWRTFATDNYKSTLVSAADVGYMRKRREREILPKKLDGVHAEIARGEMAIVLGMWDHTSNGKSGIPLPWLLTFLAEEKLPENGTWRPKHKQGLLDVVKRSKAIRTVQNGQ
ncbi:Cloroperoxidase [Dendrothele bispora CBS 962.96]|uniref:Cloroperoxidase n=1 Tax=Dendrothele bispora (strain CBS 962.96) TaxID=1314807 RepID=A0A4V4HID3_DENBC|nr:Cloroperoxidase [Dendrothele bispora CBS 962.96]